MRLLCTVWVVGGLEGFGRDGEGCDDERLGDSGISCYMICGSSAQKREIASLVEIVRAVLGWDPSAIPC